MVSTILDKILKPATDHMPVEFARKLLDVRADSEVQTRIEELRMKANSGLITSDEDAEYKEIIEAIDATPTRTQSSQALIQRTIRSSSCFIHESTFGTSVLS